jgi:membrane-associated protein
VIDLAQLDVSSPVSYLIAVLVPALDALIPVLPSETAVIALGVATAGSTDPRIAVLVALAALGAFAGDNAAYLLGRRFGPSVSRWIFAGERGARRRAWAQRSLAEYGTRIIVACRFIPGGRTAVTLTCGLIGYPRRSFILGTGLAGILWASYAFLIGRLGGRAFEGRPWAGLLVGLGLTVVVSGMIEAIRRLRGRARRRAAQPAVPPAPGPDSGAHPDSGARPGPGPEPGAGPDPGPGTDPGPATDPGPGTDPSPDAGLRSSTSPAHVLQTGSIESVCPGQEDRADAPATGHAVQIR